MNTIKREIRNFKMDCSAALKSSGYALLYASIIWLPTLLITSALVASFFQTVVITVIITVAVWAFLSVSYDMGTLNPIKWYVKWFGKSVQLTYTYGEDDDEEEDFGDWLKSNLSSSMYHTNPRPKPKMRRIGDGLYWIHYSEVKFMKAEDAIQFKILFSK